MRRDGDILSIIITRGLPRNRIFGTPQRGYAPASLAPIPSSLKRRLLPCEPISCSLTLRRFAPIKAGHTAGPRLLPLLALITVPIRQAQSTMEGGSRRAIRERAFLNTENSVPLPLGTRKDRLQRSVIVSYRLRPEQR